MNGEELLLDTLENIELHGDPKGFNAKYALEEYRKEFTA